MPAFSSYATTMEMCKIEDIDKIQSLIENDPQEVCECAWSLGKFKIVEMAILQDADLYLVNDCKTPFTKDEILKLNKLYITTREKNNKKMLKQ